MPRLKAWPVLQRDPPRSAASVTSTHPSGELAQLVHREVRPHNTCQGEAHVTHTTFSGAQQEAAAIPVSETSPEPHPLAEAGRQSTQTAGHLVERAADIGLSQADRGRQAAAQGLGNLAESIRRLSTDLESQQPAIAGVASSAADQAERTAQFLSESDARQIITKIEDAARRQPLVFLGGALLLGAIAARFLKAAGDGESSTRNAMTGTEAGSYGSPQVSRDAYAEGL